MPTPLSTNAKLDIFGAITSIMAVGFLIIGFRFNHFMKYVGGAFLFVAVIIWAFRFASKALFSSE